MSTRQEEPGRLIDVYKRQVEKALKLIKVKYEVLEAVLDFHHAKDAKILVHPEENWKALCDVGADNKRNLCATGSEQNGDVDKILEDFDYVVAVSYTHLKSIMQEKGRKRNPLTPQD